MNDIALDIRPAIRNARVVVALESTLIAHGLPWPLNLETARAAEAAVREEGATPATIAVLGGVPVIGLADSELEQLGRANSVAKASQRDLASAMVHKQTAATTVSATMALAHRAGIRVFATGGIGGAHRDTHPWDVSADLWELARTPVAVVCAGAKSILDIPRTLEILETHGVPVVGFGAADFPAFYLSSSGQSVSARVDSPEQAADLLAVHWTLGGAGVVIAQPIAHDLAIDPRTFEDALNRAERDAVANAIGGKELTPFLLKRLAAFTNGQTLKANQALIVANARLAARIAIAMDGRRTP